MGRRLFPLFHRGLQKGKVQTTMEGVQPELALMQSTRASGRGTTLDGREDAFPMDRFQLQLSTSPSFGAPPGSTSWCLQMPCTTLKPEWTGDPSQRVHGAFRLDASGHYPFTFGSANGCAGSVPHKAVMVSRSYLQRVGRCQQQAL